MRANSGTWIQSMRKGVDNMIPIWDWSGGWFVIYFDLLKFLAGVGIVFISFLSWASQLSIV